MGLGTREFIFRRDGMLLPIPQHKILRVYYGLEPMPEFAGQRVRWATVLVELEKNRPAGIIRIFPWTLCLDRHGYMRQGKRYEEFLLRLDGQSRLRRATSETADRIIRSQARILTKRLDREFMWNVTPAEEEAIRCLIWPDRKRDSDLLL